MTGYAPTLKDNDMGQKTKVLSAECEAELETWEFYSLAHDDAQVEIRDCEGCCICRVSRGINDFDLKQMLRYGKREFEKGASYGAEMTKHKLRELLGAAATKRLRDMTDADFDAAHELPNAGGKPQSEAKSD